ncbi:hypothetical protein Q5424_17885 [Conexibacter sp. JD483]|uniref:hypothetical protein n=1 Tax=unclassified Conexibacter TaxID=2627773 RepID=UPI0027200BDC|nr:MULTISPECIES: hypothetical protein [unclassified Conexibacter]MDO8185741.1 hypothetical protein [Conexibacter sp. CPCC 205706]MDO8199118.1 hypothetical protein [Conexibacter sp. CPCC 205762]MDR9370972.1 hypothetical protein [Conexibacter sp. JD483]
MSFDVDRLRTPEWLVGAGALVLFISLFLLDWYSVSFRFSDAMSSESFHASVDGWHGHTILRWFVLIVVAGGVALFVATLVSETPAIPSAIAPPLTAFALLTTVLLAYRVLLNEPGPNKLVDVDFGAYLGLLAAIATTAGAWWSLRREGGPLPDVPVTVRELHEPSAPAA